MNPSAFVSRGATYLVAALCLAGVVPATASAGTAEVLTPDSIRYTGAPGEHNDVTATARADGSVTFQDAGAPVTAGPDCDQVGPNEARCYPRAHASARVVGGDQDDRIRLASEKGAPVSLSADGGTGNDLLEADVGSTLDGGPGADTLVGSPGPDWLIGGAGMDTIDSGGGDDNITPDGVGAPPAQDFVDGGAGRDTVSYSERSTPVSVDLERFGGNGGAGENDQIRDVENVEGGSGSDRLAGDAGDNYLVGDGTAGYRTDQHDVISGRGGNDHIQGTPGDDALFGGPGNDSLTGQGGHDTLSGGPGNDYIEIDDDRPRSLSCGAGEDFISAPRPREVIPPSCEVVQMDSTNLFVRTRLRRSGREAEALPLGDLRYVSTADGVCRVVAVLSLARRGGAELGRGTLRLRPRMHDTASLLVLLTAAGRHVFSSRRHVAVRIDLETRHSCSPRAQADEAGAFTLRI